MCVMLLVLQLAPNTRTTCLVRINIGIGIGIPTKDSTSLEFRMTESLWSRL